MKIQEFEIPALLDGEQLRAELGCEVVYVKENKLVIGGDITQAAIVAGITAHKPIDKNLIQTAAKAALLARLGITADEAKLLLG
jgi:hypothetical protein